MRKLNHGPMCACPSITSAPASRPSPASTAARTVRTVTMRSFAPYVRHQAAQVLAGDRAPGYVADVGADHHYHRATGRVERQPGPEEQPLGAKAVDHFLDPAVALKIRELDVQPRMLAEERIQEALVAVVDAGQEHPQRRGGGGPGGERAPAPFGP